MDTKPGLAAAPASASQESLPGESAKPRGDSEAGKSASTAPVSSAPPVPIAFSPSATNAVSPPNRNLPGPRVKRDSVKSGRPHDPTGEHKSALSPTEQPKDLADNAALPTAMTSQDAPQRHRRHLPHKSSRGAQHQSSEAGNQEKHRGKRHKHKASGGVGEGAKKSNLELSPPVVHSELQPQATSPEERKDRLFSPTGLSEENTLETIETRVADVFSNAEHSLGQQRSENASEKPGCSDSAVTAENARCDEGSKDDGVQSGTTVSHDVEGKAVVGAAANPEADRGAGRKIGKVVVSRELKTPVGTIANAGAHESAGPEAVENSGCACAKEGDTAGVEEPKKPTGVTVVSPHAEAENIGETRRESAAAVTPTPMTQKMTTSGRQRCKRKSVDQRSLYSLTTLRDLATTLKTDSQVPVGSLHSLTAQNLRCFIVWMLTVAVVFTGVVALLLWIIGGISVSGGSGICATPACAELAASFEGILNYSVDPCNDMHAFVCSKVVRRSRGRGSLSLVADVIKQYELQMVKLFTDGQTTFTASSMVADFFRACTGAYETPPSVDSFMNFFDFVTVPWPFSDTYENDQHPLQAVLTLTLNWGITTWFRAYVDVSRRRTAAPNSSAEPVLFIEAGATASFWLDFVRIVEAVNGREKYHALFLARYNVSLPAHGSVAKRLAVEKDVLSTLNEARSPRAGLLPVVATIAKVAAAAANSDVEYWLDAVSNAPGIFDVDETMRVVVRDARIIRAVGRLLAAYSEDDLMQHLSWWLVQMLTVIGWPQAFVVIAGSQEVARSEVKVECYRMIADRFALLLASESSMELFTHDARVEVEGFFAGLVDFMEDIGSRVPWLSDKDKATLAKKVDDLEVVVWPPDVDASNETLWLLYENFCASCDRGNKSGAVPSVTTAAPRVGLIDFWWHANVQLLQLSSEQNERMQLRWLWDSLEVLTYDPWYNRLRVSHAALRNPLYRPNSPELRKANYGALGTSFFLSMLQMFEEPATDFKSDVAVPAWAELGNFSRLVDELNCSAEFLPNVREIVALGLAWHALNVSTELPAEYLRRHRGTVHTRLAIRDERGEEHLYNTDQLFFLSYCRSRCTRYHSADHSHDLNCNAAVSSIAEFRQAFKCDVGSPMAPQETCQLSDFF